MLDEFNLLGIILGKEKYSIEHEHRKKVFQKV